MRINKNNLILSKIFQNTKVILTNPLDSLPMSLFSRFYYGNLAGIRQNFFGNYHKLISRTFGKRKKRVENKFKENSNMLRKNGFLNINKEIKLDVINEVRKKIKQIEKKKKPAKDSFFLDCTKKDLKCLEEHISSLINENLRSIIEEYYGSGFIVSSISHRHTFSPNEKNENELISDFWHCDSSPKSLLQIFILFNKVDDKCGPFQVIKKRGSKKLVRKGYIRTKGDINDENIKKNIFTFTGEPGSIMVTNTAECLHRATFPKKNQEREMMYIHVLPSLKKTDLKKMNSSWIYKYTHPKKDN